MQDIIHKQNQLIFTTQKQVFLQIFMHKLNQTQTIFEILDQYNYNTIAQSDAGYYTQTQLDAKYVF